VEPGPDVSLDRLRQAEQLVPGLKEKMGRNGYSEQQLAELLDERLAAGKASPRRRFRPSQHPVGVAVTVGLAGFLGYLRTFDNGHHSRAKLPGGWVGMLIAVGVMLGVLTIMELAARRRV